MKCLLFTSAGETTILDKYWIEPTRQYDIFVCYYGDNRDNKLRKYCDYYAERKGSKFQNFHYFWNLDNDTDIEKNENKSIKPHIPIENNNNKPKFDIKSYDYYFIVDDDIIITTDGINQLFKIINHYNLYIIQPSFIPKYSQISHQITVTQPGLLMRYTNFIEVNTPVFSKETLIKCMAIYDPILVGYGIDYLFLWFLGQNQKDKYAIIDSVKCINPIVQDREINKLESFQTRVEKWNKIAKKYNIKVWEHKSFSKIHLNSIHNCVALF